MKKVLFVSLALVIALTVFMPAPALAANPQPFSASGTVDYITPGTVKPAGDSGRFVVVERELRGVLFGDVSGSFTMNYKANVELLTQAGNLHGTVQTDGRVLNVEGKVEPLEWLGVPFASPAKLTLNGHWNFTGNAQGQGIWNAMVIFVPTPEGHVGFIIGSTFTLTGQYQP